MRYLKDGSILFSASESLPNNLAGYKPDSSNPRHWIPEPEPCSHRERRVIELPCKNCSVTYYCKYFNKEVVLANCNECDEESGLVNP